MNKKFFLILIIVISHTSSFSQTPDTDNRIDSVFERWNNSGSPGCALGVVRKGRLVYRKNYGMADLENGKPISSTTIFNIGSLSKQFTAASILLLQQRGKLSLDEKVRKY